MVTKLETTVESTPEAMTTELGKLKTVMQKAWEARDETTYADTAILVRKLEGRIKVKSSAPEFEAFKLAALGASKVVRRAMANGAITTFFENSPEGRIIVTPYGGDGNFNIAMMRGTKGRGGSRWNPDDETLPQSDPAKEDNGE